MSLCTVAELKAALGVGDLYSDVTLQEVCDAADNVLLPMIWNNNYFNYAHSNTTSTGTLYFDFPCPSVFYVGQTLTITGNGSKHNGNKTLTEVGEYSITYAITGNNNTAVVKHEVNPFGTVSAEAYLDPSTIPSIQIAALLIAEDIWQARQAPDGGLDPSGVGLAYRPATLLIAKVRSLIAPYISPGSMVG